MTSKDGLPGEGTPLAIKADVAHIIQLAEPLEQLANRTGIFNVFDDGGYRTLLILTMFGLTKPPGRLGDDAVGQDGKRYELKTINLTDTRGREKTAYPGITTEHTLRNANVKRYRETTAWLIGVFQGNVPLDVWEVTSGRLEPFYRLWEQRIAASPNGEINNPKIPFGYVAHMGICHPVLGTEHLPRPKPGKFKIIDGMDLKDGEP